jgi:hypothetical protein
MLALSDDPDADAGLVQLREIAPDETFHQAHQIIDLVGRAFPVLRRKTEDGQKGYLELDRGAHGAAHGFDPLTMTERPGKAALFRPASVAVHDDSDVPRRRESARLIIG